MGNDEAGDIAETRDSGLGGPQGVPPRNDGRSGTKSKSPPGEESQSQATPGSAPWGQVGLHPAQKAGIMGGMPGMPPGAGLGMGGMMGFPSMPGGVTAAMMGVPVASQEPWGAAAHSHAAQIQAAQAQMAQQMGAMGAFGAAFNPAQAAAAGGGLPQITGLPPGLDPSAAAAMGFNLAAMSQLGMAGAGLHSMGGMGGMSASRMGGAMGTSSPSSGGGASSGAHESGRGSGAHTGPSVGGDIRGPFSGSGGGFGDASSLTSQLEMSAAMVAASTNPTATTSTIGGAAYRDFSRLPLDEMTAATATATMGVPLPGVPDGGAVSDAHGGASGKEPSFPVKLHRILSNPDFREVITWLPHGRSWRVLKPKLFEEGVIPLYFRHAKYASFMRQVNGWGFKRMTQGPDHNSYYNELFLRGLPHLCLKMRRPARSRHPHTDAAVNPDFYHLSAIAPLPNGGANGPAPAPAPSGMHTSMGRMMPGAATLGPNNNAFISASPQGMNPTAAFSFAGAPDTMGLPGKSRDVSSATAVGGGAGLIAPQSATEILQHHIQSQLKQEFKQGSDGPVARGTEGLNGGYSETEGDVKSSTGVGGADASNDFDTLRMTIKERTDLVRQLKEVMGDGGAGGAGAPGAMRTNGIGDPGGGPDASIASKATQLSGAGGGPGQQRDAAGGQVGLPQVSNASSAGSLSSHQMQHLLRQQAAAGGLTGFPGMGTFASLNPAMWGAQTSQTQYEQLMCAQNIGGAAGLTGMNPSLAGAPSGAAANIGNMGRMASALQNHSFMAQIQKQQASQQQYQHDVGNATTPKAEEL